MTDNATGDRAGTGGAGTQRGSDDPIAFTPITVPDRERGRRRNRIIGIATAVVVIAGGITTWVVVAGGGDDKPVKHTAVIPTAFGEYTQAKPDDSLWERIGGDNLDPLKKGGARITYTAPDGTGAMVTVEVDPPDYVSDDGTHHGPGSDSFTKQLLGVDDLSGVREYPAGKADGKIPCVDISARNVTTTKCAWQDEAASVTYYPVRNGKGIVDHTGATAESLRAFLDALKIEPLKS
ncbi:hypothetical protein [Streptomyces sp. NRRL F-5123]|uniref:hypothetical protein n=1 Tax=Streptomyces sp. NRRL F-5123 TaxID=1463856 RepID=UPI0004E202E7|nr:hypothetical protein [Streptomyces sp. NRRL F-5123]